MGLKNLYFKNETTNPTWSFKDRYVSVTVNAARSFGNKKIVVSSTGNLGVSAAAYSAAAGMQCLCIVPHKISRLMIAQARLYGANVVFTQWEGRHLFVEQTVKKHDWFPVGLFMPNPIHNPFGVEGYKTIGYEIIEDLGESPGAVLFPCARGNGLYGMWKGFQEAYEWGWTDGLPAMISCQPIGANSLEESIRLGVDEAVTLPPIKSVALSTAETVADSHTLVAIRKSSGMALSASDDETLAAVISLGQEGLCVEPSAALSVACLPKMLEEHRISSDSPIVCVLTGAGIKWPDQLTNEKSSVANIDATAEAIDRYLKKLSGEYSKN